MKRYEIATLTIYMGTTAKAADAVKAYTDSPESKGTLLGCWFSDIGQLNQLIIFRGFDSAEDLETERENVRRSSNPFTPSSAVAIRWHRFACSLCLLPMPLKPVSQPHFGRWF